MLLNMVTGDETTKLDLPVGIRCSDQKRDDEDKTEVKTMESNSRKLEDAEDILCLNNT